MNKILKIMVIALMLSQTAIYAKKSDDEIKINFKDLQIVDFVKMVAKITGKNILIGENVQGKVDFVSVKPIKKNEIYTLLLNVLNTKGFTIRDTKNGFLKVIRSSNSVKSAPPAFGNSDISEVQTTVIKVQKLNVRTILRQINFLLSKYGKITLSYENNSIVVTDFPANIKSIRDLIYKLDNGDKAKVRFIALQNADAKTLSRQIKKLADLLYDKKIQTQKVDVLSDEATNSIILVGNIHNIKNLIPKIKLLDIENETVDKRMEIIYIKNADAAEIVKTLDKLLSDESFAQSIKQEEVSISKIISKTKAKKTPTVQTMEIIPHIVGKGKPTVTVDTELNAVVVYATEREIREITSVIEKLDVERQQVYIKARIFEVSNDKASEIGMKYGIGGGMINSAGIFGFSGALGTLDGGLAPVTSFTSLLGGLTASNQDLVKNLSRALALGVTMSLYKQNGATSLISEPSILCVNNKEASLYAGRTESVLSQSSTGASSTALTQNSYTREDIGLTLKVKPRISADSKVSLEIKVSLEDVIGGTPGSPTTTKSEVDTVSIVTNGETVIIGGLTKEKDVENVSKIPILGDIPILGIPFRHTSTERKKSNIVIMITPYIVKRSEDLASIKEVLGKMELLESRLAAEFDKKHRVIKQEVTSSDYYYEINEYGERTRVYTDAQGRVIKTVLEESEF